MSGNALAAARLHSGGITRRRAFTLVELLVVIAIIGVLVALLLPAIQASREASRRTACSNNLKQLGIALQHFYDVHHHFPAGRGGPPPKVFSAIAHLLPFVEEGSLQGQVDFSSAPTTVVIAGKSYSGAQNAPAASQTVAVLQCPSDMSAGRVPGSTFGATNYAANAGSGTIDGGNMSMSDGVFFLESAISFQNLADGSAHTAAFGERMLGSGQTLGNISTYTAQLYMLELSNSVSVDEPTCASPASGAWYSTRGAKWILGNYGNTVYNHYYLPNGDQWDCMNQPQQKGLLTARSYHPGGVNQGLCDASVRFIDDGIALVVWRALATRAGAEAVDMP